MDLLLVPRRDPRKKDDLAGGDPNRSELSQGCGGPTDGCLSSVNWITE